MSDGKGRRSFLKQSLFGSLGIAGLDITDAFTERNHDIVVKGYTPKRKQAKSPLVIAHNHLPGSSDFPIRYASDHPDYREVERATGQEQRPDAYEGDWLWFAWPKSDRSARAAITQAKGNEARIVFRLRYGRPDLPYWPRWQNKGYWLYTPPGALVSRASYMIKTADDFLASDNADEYEAYALQALSDLRFAVLLNCTVCDDSQDVLDRMSDIDRGVREANLNLNPFWGAYKELLSETNPQGG